MTDQTIAGVVGETLAKLGADLVFGAVGSGDLHVTTALMANGSRFVATRHESGAVTAADAYARVSGRVSVVTVHQGCGLTNALTAITEAAQSRTPMLVLASEPAPTTIRPGFQANRDAVGAAVTATRPGFHVDPVTAGAAATGMRSSFRVDQDALVRAVGAASERVHSPASAVADTARAWRSAMHERRTVVLHLSLEVQVATAEPAALPTAPAIQPPRASDDAVTALAHLLRNAERPVFIAGRGALEARTELADLAAACGALLATSTAAKGLFSGVAWNLDVAGVLATPLATELIRAADVVVAWGASLETWTSRHGSLIGPDTTVVQVDVDASALGAHHRIDLGITGDTRSSALAVTAALTTPAASRAHAMPPPTPAAPCTPAELATPAAPATPGTPAAPATPGTPTAPSMPATPAADSAADALSARRVGYRTEDVRVKLRDQGRWRDVACLDDGDDTHIDPRTLSIALDDMLPADRVVVVDSGAFVGYPSMFLTVPDHHGSCFTQSFPAIGLGLAGALGAALAEPGRLPVVAYGVGGFLAGIAELDTVRRLGLGILVVIYDDEADGDGANHSGPVGHAPPTVALPQTDLAAVARGHGCEAVTVRSADDLVVVREWLDGPRESPLVVDAKVTADRATRRWEEALRDNRDES